MLIVEMLILKSMHNWDSEIIICSRFVNCDLVIWTQPSGPLCLWQCFCSTGISGWLYFWTPSQYFAWQSFDVVEGWLWLGQALSKPWPYQRGGSFDPCQVFQWFLLSDIGPKWDLTAHPEYFLIRLWAFQGKPSNKICGVAQNQKTLSFFSNIYLWNRNSWSWQWWRKAERRSKASICKICI